MPEAKIRRRGGAIRWRTIKPKRGRYIHIAVVPKAGSKGGHTIAGKVHHTKSNRLKAKRGR